MRVSRSSSSRLVIWNNIPKTSLSDFRHGLFVVIVEFLGFFFRNLNEFFTSHIGLVSGKLALPFAIVKSLWSNATDSFSTAIGSHACSWDDLPDSAVHVTDGHCGSLHDVAVLASSGTSSETNRVVVLVLLVLFVLTTLFFDRSDSSESSFELSFPSFTVFRMIEAGNSVFVWIALGFFALHVLLHFKWVLSVVVNAISADDDKLSMPWSETLSALDHAENLTTRCLSAVHDATFNFVDSWREFAGSSCADEGSWIWSWDGDFRSGSRLDSLHWFLISIFRFSLHVICVGGNVILAFDFAVV